MENEKPLYLKNQNYVYARYKPTQNYYLAKIIKTHDYDRYDVQFVADNVIQTVFKDEIRPDGNDPILTRKHNYDIDHKNDHNNDSNSNSVIHHNHNANDNNKRENNLTIDEIRNILNASDKELDKCKIVLDNKHINDDMLKNMENNLNQKKKIEIEIPAISNNEKLDSSKVYNTIQILRNIGGSDEFIQELFKDYSNQANDIFINILTKASEQDEKNEHSYIKKLLSVKKLEQYDDNNKLNSTYEIRYDHDYSSIVDHDAVKKNIHHELSNILRIDEKLIEIKEIKSGSVIVLVAITFGAVALILGLLAFGRYYWVNRKRNRSLIVGESDDFTPGSTISVSYNNKIYSCKILQYIQNFHEISQIKVEYVKHPFFFRNTEIIPCNSDRIKIENHEENQLNNNDDVEPGASQQIVGNIQANKQGVNIQYQIYQSKNIVDN